MACSGNSNISNVQKGNFRGNINKQHRHESYDEVRNILQQNSDEARKYLRYESSSLFNGNSRLSRLYSKLSTQQQADLNIEFGVNESKIKDTSYVITSSCVEKERVIKKVNNAFSNKAIIRLHKDGKVSLIEVQKVTIGLIKQCGNNYPYARALVNNLTYNKIPANSRVYTTLIAVCVKNGLFLKAQDVVDEMQHNGIKANLITYNTFISVCVKGGLIEEAWSIYNRMQLNGTKADVITYNTLMSVCVKDGLFLRAQAIFDDMRRNVTKADIITYNTFISVCVNGGLIEEAQAIFDDMRRNGTQANIITYTTLMYVYAKGKHLGKILEIFQDMQRNRISINDVTFTILISVCEECGEWKQTLDIIEFGIRKALFKKHFGFVNGVLNLHENEIYKNYTPNNKLDDHISAVSLPMASAILKYLLGKGEIVVRIIVGYHGANILKEGMLKLLDWLGYDAVVNKYNPGQLDIRN